jgi:hypothetical protein
MSIVVLVVTLLLSFPVYSADKIDRSKLNDSQMRHLIHGERLPKEFMDAKVVIEGQPTETSVAGFSYMIIEKLTKANFEWKTFTTDSGYRKSVIGYGLKFKSKDKPDDSGCMLVFNYTPGDTASEINFVKCGGRSLGVVDFMLSTGLATADGQQNQSQSPEMGPKREAIHGKDLPDKFLNATVLEPGTDEAVADNLADFVQEILKHFDYTSYEWLVNERSSNTSSGYTLLIKLKSINTFAIVFNYYPDSTNTVLESIRHNGRSYRAIDTLIDKGVRVNWKALTSNQKIRLLHGDNLNNYFMSAQVEINNHKIPYRLVDFAHEILEHLDYASYSWKAEEAKLFYFPGYTLEIQLKDKAGTICTFKFNYTNPNSYTQISKIICGDQKYDLKEFLINKGILHTDELSD